MESIEEMQHADPIINRMLILDGVPNVAGCPRIMVGKSQPVRLRAQAHRSSLTG